MNTQDRRFLEGVLGTGLREGPLTPPTSTPEPESYTLWTFRGIRRWPWRPHEGVYTALMHTGQSSQDRFALVASWGAGITGIEISAGIDIRLPAMDKDAVYGRADRLLGQLAAPETAPATKDTVQIEFTEHLPNGDESFGLAKVRARMLWCDGTRHILRIHRQMPIGWPEGDHHEADESALTGRTAPVGRDAHLYFGLPWRTDAGRRMFAPGILYLDKVLAWMRTLADAD